MTFHLAYPVYCTPRKGASYTFPAIESPITIKDVMLITKGINAIVSQTIG